MAPVSAVERQRKRRALLKENGKYDDQKKRNAAYNRKYNEKKKNEFKNLLKEEKSKLISEKRLKERQQQQKHREKLRHQCTPNISKDTVLYKLYYMQQIKLESIYHTVLLTKSSCKNISKLFIYDRKQCPTGLRHCSKNRKVLVSNLNRCSARLSYPTLLRGSQ